MKPSLCWAELSVVRGQLMFWCASRGAFKGYFLVFYVTNHSDCSEHWHNTVIPQQQCTVAEYKCPHWWRNAGLITHFTCIFWRNFINQPTRQWGDQDSKILLTPSGDSSVTCRRQYILYDSEPQSAAQSFFQQPKKLTVDLVNLHHRFTGMVEIQAFFLSESILFILITRQINMKTCINPAETASSVTVKLTWQ